MICCLLVGNKYRLGDALLSIERPFRGLHTIILSLRDGSLLPFNGTLQGHKWDTPARAFRMRGL
jgi:hypothetical protein